MPLGNYGEFLLCGRGSSALDPQFGAIYFVQMLHIHSISLGCPKNRVDTERALGALAAPQNLRTVATPEEADLVFINTCGFIAPAVEESVRVMLEAVRSIQAMPENDRPVLAVAGCLVGRYSPKALAPDLPEVDLLLDNKDMDSWQPRLLDLLRKRGKLKSGTATPLPCRLLSTGPSYAWLKISDGCRHNCAFCTIPGIRGSLRSTPADVLVAESAFLLEQGVKELIVIAQDSTAWGADMGLKHGLASLLEQLLPLQGLERLRLMYLYPAGLSKNLLTFLKEAGDPFVPYFDVPLQHASASILRSMGRPFAGRPQESVERIRSLFPNAALRTSLITGFPGETDDDFDQLRQFVIDSRFMHLGVFAYEAEDGTKAATMKKQVPVEERHRRRDEIMAIQAEISEELLENCVGGRERILVDAEQGEWPGLHIGRTWFQAPDIDGVTYVSGPGVQPGAMVEADIVESSVYDLTALA